MMSARVPAIAAGAATRSVSTMTSNSLGMGAATLAALSCADRRERAAHSRRPVGMRVAPGDCRAPRDAEARTQRRVVLQAAQRGRQRVLVAGRDDETGLLVP